MSSTRQGTTPLEEQIRLLVPSLQSLSADLPPQALRYLTQARQTLASPDSSVMTSASAVDAMLKGRNYTTGSHYSRIAKAESDSC